MTVEKARALAFVLSSLLAKLWLEPGAVPAGSVFS